MHLFLYSQQSAALLERAQRAFGNFFAARIADEDGLFALGGIPAGGNALVFSGALLTGEGELRPGVGPALDLPVRILGIADGASGAALAALARHPRAKLLDADAEGAMDALSDFAAVPSLEKAFSIRRGVSALVGGGGKTSLMHRLGRELCASGKTLLCTSTHIMAPDCTLLLEPTEEEIARAFDREPLIAIGAYDDAGKLGPCRAELMDRLSSLADYAIVEADGSKRLPLKAPAEHEPVLPAGTDLVIALAGMSGVFRPIREAAHRAERYAQLLGKSAEDLVTPSDIARVLSHPLGQRKNVPGRFCAALNQAESPKGFQAALACAMELDCDAAIVSLLSDRPVIERWRNRQCIW